MMAFAGLAALAAVAVAGLAFGYLVAMLVAGRGMR